MDFQLNPERPARSATWRAASAEREIAPRRAGRSRQGFFPDRCTQRACRSSGLLGINLPETVGGGGPLPGAGAGHRALLPRLAWASAPRQHGTRRHRADRHRREPMRAAAATSARRGSRCLASFAMTEPAPAPTWLASAPPRRARRGLSPHPAARSGSPTPTSPSSSSFSRPRRTAVHRGMSALHRAARQRRPDGGRARQASSASAVRPPARSPRPGVRAEDHRLGEEGGGFALAMAVFDHSRAPDGGRLRRRSHRRCLDESLAYATQRSAWAAPDRPPGRGPQAAEMRMKLEAARLLTYQSPGCSTRVGRTPSKPRSPGLRRGRAAMWRRPRRCRFGGMGYSTEYPVESSSATPRCCRSEGTSEIQRNIIARELQRA